MDRYRALDEYSGENAAAYDARRFSGFKGMVVDRLEWRAVREGIRLLGGRGSVSRVLDVPAGTGRMGRRLRDAGFEVVAVDVSEDMLQSAKRRDAAEEYRAGRIEGLPIEAGYVDAAVSARLFGHLPRPSKEAALREMARVSRVGVVVLYARDAPLQRWRPASRARRAAEEWYPIRDSELIEIAASAGIHGSALPPITPWSETAAFVGRTAGEP